MAGPELLTAADPIPDRVVGAFYARDGWEVDETGSTLDARLWEDLRPAAADYVAACRRRLLAHLPERGGRFLDAASGPIQYPEYLEYARGYDCRVCVDISAKALDGARAKLGDRGAYVRCSVTELPFPDDHFDAVVSLHTIYHIDRERQEAAVRQLLRVIKPGGTVVIVYANPDRLLARLKRSLKRRGRAMAGDAVLYFHPHPLAWWSRFADRAEVALLPWRSLKAEDSRRLVPDNRLGKWFLNALFRLEDAFPGPFTKGGAYPLILLKKNSAG